MNARQKLVMQLSDADKHADAIQAIEELDWEDQLHERIMIAKADAYYELANDIEALNAYSACVNRHPKGCGIGFVLFGIAMCLKNLHLDEEALAVLKNTPDGHENRGKEMEESLDVVFKKIRAREILGETKFTSCLDQR